MTETNWSIAERGPGRLYQRPQDLVINDKFDDTKAYVQTIAKDLKAFLQLETSVRLLLDSPTAHPTAAVLSVPFEGEQDTIYTNLATLIYQQMWGYYLAADPKSTHHGLTTLVLEGNENSLVRRECEKFLDVVTTRNELGARAMRNYHMACEMPPFNRDVYLKETTSKFLDIRLGVRMYTYGEGVERKTVFLPISTGAEAIDRIYYNLEHIVHQNLVAYDEVHDHYLPISEELICREVESLLTRALHKGNTRKKIINGLKFHTVMLEEGQMINHISLADLYYDKINRIDMLDEASQRSRELFSTALIRSTEMTLGAGVNVDTLQMEERIYIERPASRTAETVGATVSTGEPAAAQPAAAPPEQPAETGEEATATTTQTDGLEEL
ncbi:MAG: hypothetical protein O7A69_07200 [SAR324 cluster bacterium]|nr:hypothetical protein [SAR324 cluster bacterium]MCZ6645718.1 hypothetical protein [SAR324 cluster bacterium]MCZ6842050.1 hypothetical protein [SAR324 cluster bacterium]